MATQNLKWTCLKCGGELERKPISDTRRAETIGPFYDDSKFMPFRQFRVRQYKCQQCGQVNTRQKRITWSQPTTADKSN